MKQKKQFILGILFLITTVGLLLHIFTWKANIQKGLDTYKDYKNITQGVLQLTDTYDSESSSFSDFIDSTDALQIENDAYNRLTTNAEIEYYEVIDNPLDYLGFYNKHDNARHDFINETYDEQEMTSCEGLSIDQRFYDTFISKYIKSPNGFSSKDFNANITKTIPVILGSSYKDDFQLGETFNALFVCDTPIEFVVTGFLEENAVVDMNGTYWSIDDYIILPNISIDSIPSEREQIIMRSLQIEGLIFYNSQENFQKAANIVNNISNETNFNYTYIFSATDYISFKSKQNDIKIKYEYALLCLCFISGLYLTIRSMKKEHNTKWLIFHRQ